MPVQHIKIPEKSLKGSKYTKEQQLLVVKALFMQINLKLFRAQTIFMRIPKFGVISTNGNKKSSKQKYQKEYNKKLWKDHKKRVEFSEKHLLF